MAEGYGQQQQKPRPAPRGRRTGDRVVRLAAVAMAAAVGYGLYAWEFRRVVVDPGHVLVLIRKDGARSLPGDQIVIPRPPPRDDPAYAQWDRAYGDCNGVLEQVYPEGTYFGFSPFDYEREVVDVAETAIVPNGKVGVVIRKFGGPLPDGQVLAGDGERGPLPVVLQPARYNEYANPYAYEVRHVDPVQVDPGYRGVVTVMAGRPAATANGYLVGDGEQGTQRATEPEGFRYVNPYVKRVTPVSVQSQRFEMGTDPKSGRAYPLIFPSADGFSVEVQGFVEWAVVPRQLPLTYVQYSEGGDLVPYLEEKVILPYARSFCRTVGSQYHGRDFIEGETKERFRRQFEAKLREACAKEGVEIRQAWIRDITPPEPIRAQIADRGQSLQEVEMLHQQIAVAKQSAELATQTQMSDQNDKVGQANAQVVTMVKQAEQAQGVAVTGASQELAVAKVRLEAARQQAAALVARGRAEADVVLLQKQAEAAPLKAQVAAFGGGEAYARYFFYQHAAPAIRSILAPVDGPLADVIRQLGGDRPTTATTRPADVRVARASRP